MESLNTARLMIAACLLTPLWAQDTILLIDYSGSMRPYYEQGAVQDLARMVMPEAARRGGIQLAAFSTSVTPLKGLSDLQNRSYGQNTYLDQAVDSALQGGYSVAWIITDNIQDPADQSVIGNTEVFYDRLQGEPVRKVTIFPLLQAQGLPGLVVYCLQLKAAADQLYEAQISSLLTAAEGSFKMEALRMKPLDRETVVINMLRDDTAAQNGGSRYSEGDHVRETMRLRLLSKFEHLRIEDAKIEVEQSRVGFPPGSVLVPEQEAKSINPVRVDLGPGEESEIIYEVNFDLGKVRIKKDLASLWKAAFGEAWEKPVLVLSLKIRVPQRNFRFKEPFLEEYSAASPEAAKQSGKVYGIETLPVLLGGESTLILSEQEIPIRIDYPWWPALLFIGGFILLLAVAGGIVWFVKPLFAGLFSATRWTVEASAAGTGRRLPCEVSSQGQVSVQGIDLGTIQGGTFSAEPGVEVIGEGSADGKVKLEQGRQVQLKQSKLGAVLLTFQKPGGGSGGTEETPQQLPTRR